MPERRTVDELREELHAQGRVGDLVVELHDQFDTKFTRRANTNADAARKAYRVVIAAIVFFGFGISGVGLIFRHQNSERVSDNHTLALRAADNAHQTALLARATSALAKDTNNALCALRSDLEKRVAITQRLLAQDHLPAVLKDIDPTTIRQSIANQKATIRSLAELHCT